MSVFDSFGDLADTVGGWLGDVAHEAVGVTTDLAQINSAINAVNKPPTGPKGAPKAVAAGAAVGPPASADDNTLIVVLVLGLGAYLIWRHG